MMYLPKSNQIFFRILAWIMFVYRGMIELQSVFFYNIYTFGNHFTHTLETVCGRSI